jgi:hypothetical protein
MHRAEPAEPHQLSDTARVLAVGFDRHHLEGGPHMPGLEQLIGRAVKKMGHRPGADRRKGQKQRAERSANTGTHPTPHLPLA